MWLEWIISELKRSVFMRQTEAKQILITFQKNNTNIRKAFLTEATQKNADIWTLFGRAKQLQHQNTLMMLKKIEKN